MFLINQALNDPRMITGSDSIQKSVRYMFNHVKVQDLDPAYFKIQPVELAGETVFLITPNDLDLPWTPDTLIFRSSVWSKDGEPISLSFKKFFNWGEKSDLIPLPDPSDFKLPSIREYGLHLLANRDKVDWSRFKSITCEFITKIDGSALIVSKWKGHLIVRTRGTIDATTQDNGFEIPILMKKYPEAFEFEDDTPDFTRIFEWTTPTNKIILDYGKEPLLWLIGMVFHEDYTYAQQSILDIEAKMIGVLRPERHQFNTLSEMLKEVQAFEDKEGVCVYSDSGQVIHKVKGLKYLMMHRFKEHASPKAILELFLEQGCPPYDVFKEFFIQRFDFECFGWVEKIAGDICRNFLELKSTLDEVSAWVKTIEHLPTKKEAAMLIQDKYAGSSLMPGAFLCLNKKNLYDVKYVKRMLQERMKIEDES